MGYPALFYNAVDGDRVYDADSFERWLKKFFSSGVFAGDLPVTAGSGMIIAVGTGYANTDGKVAFFDDPTMLDIATAHSTLRRIDNIVVERNDIDRDITIKVITGTPAASPRAPDVVRENGVYQLVLAQVEIPAGATAITNDMIRDTRVPAEDEDPVLCGIVCDATGNIDITGLYATLRGQFDEWFAALRAELSGDVAANLQMEIQSMKVLCLYVSGLMLPYNASTGKYEQEIQNIRITEDMAIVMQFGETAKALTSSLQASTTNGALTFSCDTALVNGLTLSGTVLLIPAEN